VDKKEFQKRALESFTRLEEGQVELKEGYYKLEEGQAELKKGHSKLDVGQEELKKDIQFLHDDMNSKFEMLANAIKELVEKMATKEDYERRFRDLENRIRELEQKIGQ
jgi:exonuclease VII small subunit